MESKNDNQLVIKESKDSPKTLAELMVNEDFNINFTSNNGDETVVSINNEDIHEVASLLGNFLRDNGIDTKIKFIPNKKKDDEC